MRGWTAKGEGEKRAEGFIKGLFCNVRLRGNKYLVAGDLKNERLIRNKTKCTDSQKENCKL